MLFKPSVTNIDTRHSRQIYKKQFAFLDVHYLVRYMPQMLYSLTKIIKQSANDRRTIIILKMARSSKKVVNIELQVISLLHLFKCHVHRIVNCKMWDSSCVPRRDLYLKKASHSWLALKKTFIFILSIATKQHLSASS